MDKAIRVVGLIAALVLVGCGGSGGGGGIAKFSGTAATGAPMAGATVEIYDSTGAIISTVKADQSGDFETPSMNSLTGPYVIKATLDGKSLYSVQAKGEEARVNVTPHTNLIAALLSPSGNAENLSTEIKSDKAVATEDKIGSKKEIVKNIISPVTKVLEVTSVDPISSKISANGQGYDRALDSTNIFIMPEVSGGVKSSNIQVTYKTKLDFTDAQKSNLKTVGFKNTTPSVDVSNINFTAEDIIEAGQMPKILAWVKSHNDCMKLPPSQRWEGSPGSKQPLAQVCKDIFYTGNIHSFIADGKGVEDLFGLFANDPAYTVDVITQPEYVYSMVNNGRTEILIHIRAILSDGTYRFFFFNLTPDSNNNNELRWRGNDYRYLAAVYNYNQIRRFPYSPDYDATFSGYQFDIPTKIKDSQGNSVSVQDENSNPVTFDKVVVTTPGGLQSFVLRDVNPSLVSLSVCKPDAVELTESSKCSGTPYYILQSRFMNTATRTYERPVQYKDIAIYDYGQTNDEVIQNLPTFGTYKFELYINGSNSPVIQYMPYFGRPKTHSEIIQADATGLFPKLTQSTIDAFWRSTDRITGQFDIFKLVIPDSVNPFNLAWTGMANFLTIYGEVTALPAYDFLHAFEILKFTAPTSTSLSVPCEKINITDKQCLEGSNSAKFAVGENNSTYSTFITYISIGNYFSDFATNVTAYSFFGIENNPQTWPQ